MSRLRRHTLCQVVEQETPQGRQQQVTAAAAQGRLPGQVSACVRRWHAHNNEPDQKQKALVERGER